MLSYLAVHMFVVFAQVVYFASETFHYHKADRMRIKMRRFATEQWPDTIGKKVSSGLPLKVSHLHLTLHPSHYNYSRIKNK